METELPCKLDTQNASNWALAVQAGSASWRELLLAALAGGGALASASSCALAPHLIALLGAAQRGWAELGKHGCRSRRVDVAARHLHQLVAVLVRLLKRQLAASLDLVF